MESLEPVEIEIRMNQNVSEESERVTQSVTGMSQTAQTALDAMQKQITDQTEVISQMGTVIAELRKQLVEQPGDILPADTVARLSEAQAALTEASARVETFRNEYTQLSEAASQGADVTDLIAERNENLRETQASLTDTMGELLTTQAELNQANDESADASDSNTEATEESSMANELLSGAIGKVCEMLGIENQAVIQAVTNTQNITAAKGFYARAVQYLNTQLGISIGLSKALIATGIGAIIAAVGIAVIAYREWTEESRIQEAVQNNLNRINEESAKTKKDLADKTSDLVSTINSQTKAIVDQVEAYHTLQTLYPKVLANMDMQTFKAMSATQQQKLLNEALAEMTATSFEDKLNELKEAYSSISKESIFNPLDYLSGRSKVKDAIGTGFFENLYTSNSEQNKILAQTISLLEEQKKKQDEIKAQAEFMKKPESERRAILEDQLKTYKDQLSALDGNTGAVDNFNTATGKGSILIQDIKDKADNVTGSINVWEQKPDALGNIFSNASLQAAILQGQIKTIQGQLDSMNGGGAGVVKNKEYWEKRKKAFKDFREGLDIDVLTKLEKGESILPSLVSSNYKEMQAIQDSYKKYKDSEKEVTDNLKIYDPDKKKKKTGKTEAQKQAEKEKKANEDLSKKSIDYADRIRAAEVAARQEGAEKERAALKAEYEKTKSLIEKELIEIANAEKITGKPATKQRSQLADLESAATAEYEAGVKKVNEESAKALKDIFDDVSRKFKGELDNNLLSIDQYYEAAVKSAKQAGASVEQINILTAAKDKETHLAKLAATQKEIDFETDVALRREQISKKRYLFEADRQTALVKIQREGAQKTLENLKKQYALTPTKELEKDIKDASLALDEFDKKLKNLKVEKLKEIAGYISQSADALGDLFSDGGALSNETLSQITGAVGNIAQGFASGGLAGGIIAGASTAIGFINSAFDAEKRHQEALKVLQQAKIAMQREYLQLLLDEQLLYKEGTSIYGTDQVGKVVNAIDVYRQAVKQLNNEVKGTEPTYSKPKNLYDISNSYKEYQRLKEAYDKGVGGLADTQIVTGHKKTGLFGWGKGKDTYSSILDAYDDVIDAEGNLNYERIQSILNTQKMTDETKAYLQNLLDLKDKAEDAQEAMRSVLESTFGGLGDSLSDAIVSAFSNGEDALEKFRSSVTNVLNDFAKQMVYSLFLSKELAQLQKDIEDIYSEAADGSITEEQLAEKITNLLGGYFDGLGDSVDKANNFLEQFWKNAEEKGFDRPDTSSSSGTSKGIASISQDSADSIDGGIYALRQSVNDIRNIEKEANAVLQSYKQTLDRIAENTGESARYLRLIDEKLQEIQTRGINILK